MGHWTYAALLVGCLVVTAPLEILLRARVYARWRRFLLAVLPVFVVFVAWVLYAIDQGHWDYSPERTLGIRLPGGIPLEEVLFFVVVPLASVLAFEAVRRGDRLERGLPRGGGGPVSYSALAVVAVSASWSSTSSSCAPGWSPGPSSGPPTRSSWRSSC